MAATMAPNTHIRKRPFQPSIDSYFNARNAPSSSAPERARSPMSPPLSEDTQASLLSVGMRVRKSVPEGYKTHKTMGGQEAAFPFPSTAPIKQMERAARGYQRQKSSELMPFCGLHKVGGWGAQEPSSSAPAVLGDEWAREDDMPGLTMSQGTLGSSQGSLGLTQEAFGSNSRKRTYEEEVEDDLDAYFNDIDAAATMAPAHRPMARMKQPARKERLGNAVHIVGENDFEEAVFLAPPDGMDVDGL